MRKKKLEPIKAEKYGELSEEEILAKAAEIKARNKSELDKMPISSPENARAYLEACGYENLPPAKPTF